jgi:hypothetical protein
MTKRTNWVAVAGVVSAFMLSAAVWTILYRVVTGWR